MKNIGLKFCRNGHAVGRMIRNGAGVEYLELFREAIDYRKESLAEVDVLAVIPAGFGIRCSLCPAVVNFHQSGYAGAIRTFGEQEE